MTLQTTIRTWLSLPTWAKRRLRPSIELADYPIRTTEKLRFADTDRNGHVSNAVFAVCCQNARMEILHDPGRIPLPIDVQFVIARLEIEFLDEMHWPGTVAIGTRLDRIGRSSVTMVQSLFLGDCRVANANSIVALVDRSTRRATPFPQETVRALRTLAGIASARRSDLDATSRLDRAQSATSRHPDQ